MRTPGGSRKLSRVAVWAAGAMLAAVLALTGYSALSGGGDVPDTPSGGAASTASAPQTTPSASASSKPVPMYTAPATWTEPKRWLAAPRGIRNVADGSREVGFPRTFEGAIGMMVAASWINVEGLSTLAEQQLDVYNIYLMPADRSPTAEQKVRQGAEQVEAKERAALGLPVTGPLPGGASLRTTMIGFKPIETTPTMVAAHVLTVVTAKGGEMEPEQTVYIVGILAAVWQDGDWRLSGQTIKALVEQRNPMPPIAAPGDAAFNTAGWTAIRQAS